jgi:hypothetical protein
MQIRRIEFPLLGAKADVSHGVFYEYTLQSEDSLRALARV